MREPAILSFLSLLAVTPAAAQQTSGRPAVERVAAAEPATAARTFSGLAGTTALTLPRMETADGVVIDGVLDEAVWASAPLLTGFSQFRPVDRRPAEDVTEARVWYAPEAIYIGIRAHAPAGTIRASLAERDKIEKDDFVQVLLDTFNDRRQALAFGVNPLGVQADGIKSEGGQQPRGLGGGGGGGQGGQPGQPGQGGGGDGIDRGLDLSPDFVWQSKGRLTPYGYEVEMRIPFKSLRFQSARVQDWGLNVVRKVQRSGYEDSWTPAVRAASFLAQSGSIRGMQGLQRGLVLDLNPVTVGRIDGAPDSVTGRWDYRSTPEIGGNIRWGMTTSLTLAGTVNPDFSQVEADAAQAPPDPRFALFFQEKRPFFVDGIEQFNTVGQLIYTRRITDPIGALKLTGKVGSVALGVLSAVEDTTGSDDGTHRPLYNLVRIRKDLGVSSTMGLAYTDKVDGPDFNRVAVADARLLWGGVYRLELEAGGSVTRRDGVTGFGEMWDVWADRAGRNFGYLYRIQGWAPKFEAQSGYIRRTGVVTLQLNNRITTLGARGARVENWTNRLSFNGTWNYQDFLDRKPPVETRTGWFSELNVRGGWRVSTNPVWETFVFDPAFHDGYFTSTLTPFLIPGRIHNLGVINRVDSPQMRWGSFSLQVIAGRDIDQFEFAPAWLFSSVATVDLKPTEQLRINAQYTRRYLTRKRDGTHVSIRDIPRLKVEYQVARPLFFRFVGQYDASARDALRDPRTDALLLIENDETGLLVPSTRSVVNDFRMDALLSYQPSPGTVVFLGYGSSLTEADAFAFRRVGRVRDGFFLKLSYLYRF